MAAETETPLNNVIRIDDERIKGHLDRVVRGTVEETLNALLDAEADRLCNAEKYERTDGRRDTRAGHYERGLHTKAGEVTLKVPKLRRQTFETAIIERSAAKSNDAKLSWPTFTSPLESMVPVCHGSRLVQRFLHCLSALHRIPQ